MPLYTGNRNDNLKTFLGGAGADQGFYGGQARRRTQQYDNALQNPTATADQFGQYFRQAAEGIAAPAQRDFQNTLSTTRANIASRFGGNASTEEERGAYNTSDLFSRNLTESLSRLAPQQAQMGLDYTNMLGQGAQSAFNNSQSLQQLILQAIGQQPKGGGFLSGLGGFLGSGLGALSGLGGLSGIKKLF